MTSTPCADWSNGGATKVISGRHGSQNDPESRIFVRFDTADQAEGVCYREFRSTAHYCVNLSGSPMAAIPNFTGFRSNARSFAELHLGGRTFFPQGFAHSATECWDWTTQSSCGRATWNSTIGLTRDYGYVAEGDCIFGLGDSSIFWSFDRDLNSPCTSSSATIDISPCICTDGSAAWGEISIENVDLTRMDGFTVELTAPDGSVLDTVDMLASAAVMDLAHIPTTYPTILMTASIDPSDGYDPWAAGVGPTITATLPESSIPKLIQ